MMQDIYAPASRPAGGARARRRRDVGGCFGIKLHVYGDEMATAAVALLLGGRSSSSPTGWRVFISDIHARDHRVRARHGGRRDGRHHRRSRSTTSPASARTPPIPAPARSEATRSCNLIGGPYAPQLPGAHRSVVFQNKAPMCQYRAVGHPIACAVTEGLVDLGAARARDGPGRDPPAQPDPRRCLSLRVADRAAGSRALSHHACLDKLAAADGLRRAARRAGRACARGIHRGIGLAAFIELTNPGAGLLRRRRRPHPRAGRRDDAARAAGARRCAGQRHRAGAGHRGASWRRSWPTALGVPIETASASSPATPTTTPYGGGTWASRGAGDRRRGRAGRRPRAARQHPRPRRRHPAGRARARSTSATAPWWTRDRRRRA